MKDRNRGPNICQKNFQGENRDNKGEAENKNNNRRKFCQDEKRLDFN